MKHYEAKIKDLEVSLFQQRNLNNKLEQMLRDLIGKFKKQKNKIKDELSETANAKENVEIRLYETSEVLDQTLEKKTTYKEKAKRHKRKHLKYADNYSACEKNLILAQDDVKFLENLLDAVTDANVRLYDSRERAYEYLQYCVVGWKYRFKQWWTGIYHIDKLRDKL